MVASPLRTHLIDAEPTSAGNAFRKKRFARFMQLVEGVLEERGRCKIIDLGGTNVYWHTFAPDLAENVEVLVIDLGERQGADTTNVTFQNGDACKLPQFETGAFDIVHSNSTLEHVGSWSNMERMAGEVSRLAPRYFVQTPNFWFPIEPHARSLFFPLAAATDESTDACKAETWILSSRQKCGGGNGVCAGRQYDRRPATYGVVSRRAHRAGAIFRLNEITNGDKGVVNKYGNGPTLGIMPVKE